MKNNNMENKEQNTELEQAAQNYYLETKYRTPSCKKHFKAGASWQSSQAINSGWVSVEQIQDKAFEYYNSNEHYKVSDSFHFSNGYKQALEDLLKTPKQ